MNAEVKSEMDRVFGSILKQYRNKMDYTQADMAEKLGISEKYVSRVETGIGGISKETLAKYINLLGITPNLFYKEFVTNPRVKKEIEVSEKLSELSTEKLEVVLQMAKMIKDLKKENEQMDNSFVQGDCSFCPEKWTKEQSLCPRKHYEPLIFRNIN